MARKPLVKSNGQHPAQVADTSAPTETIPFADAVAKCKALKAQQAEAERSNYLLGEYAHKVVHPTYGDGTLAKLAEAIGEKSQRLEVCRSVWRAWDGAGIFAPGQISFAVLKELMDVPDRGELVTAEPNMTKRRAEVYRVLKDHPQRAEILSEHPKLSCATEARKAIREYNSDGAEEAQADEWSTDNRKWESELIVALNNFKRLVAFRKRCTPEQWQRVAQDVDPSLGARVRNVCEEGLELADALDDPFEKEADTLIQEGRVKTTPATRPSRRIQTSA